jgi:hypothetical protein
MPYALVLIAVIALSGAYIFVTDTPYWSKALVLAVLLLSFFWRYGVFVRLALGIFLALYFTYVKARNS